MKMYERGPFIGGVVRALADTPIRHADRLGCVGPRTQFLRISTVVEDFHINPRGCARRNSALPHLAWRAARRPPRVAHNTWPGAACACMRLWLKAHTRPSLHGVQYRQCMGQQSFLENGRPSPKQALQGCVPTRASGCGAVHRAARGE